MKGELYRLHYFLAVAECLHFGRAAERLNVVQSAVSQQIKQLEDELGVSLLKRSRRRVELTQSGRLFMTAARRAIDQAGEACRLARAGEAGLEGSLSLGFVDNALWSILPPILRTFHAQFPLLALDLKQMDRQTLIGAIQNATTDVGIFPGPHPGRGFEAERLTAAPLFAALPMAHPLANRRKIPLQLLEHEPFVMFPASMETRLSQLITSGCAACGFLPRVTHEAQQLSTLLTLVSAGLGITMVPRWVVSPHPRGVVYREIAPSISYELVVAWRAGDSDSVLRNFRSVIHQLGDNHAPNRDMSYALGV